MGSTSKGTGEETGYFSGIPEVSIAATGGVQEEGPSVIVFMWRVL